MSYEKERFLAALRRAAEAVSGPTKDEEMNAREYAAHLLTADKYSPVVEAFLIEYRYKPELQGELSETTKNDALTLANLREEVERLRDVLKAAEAWITWSGPWEQYYYVALKEQMRAALAHQETPNDIS